MTLVRRVRVKTDYENILQGLEFIIRHFGKGEELFPRKIMTYKLGYQKVVNNIDEAMRYFAESEYVDCRIRAYPNQSPLAKYLHRNEIAPSIIMMDVDKSRFSSNRGLETLMSTIKSRLREEIGGIPTILWSGNGYHIIQPIDATILENIADLESLDEKPSEHFLRFASSYQSDGGADANHINTISFGNCLLRIPGSFNSKTLLKNSNVRNSLTQVRIIQKWNGCSPNIRLLLGNFHAYLVDQRLKQIRSYGEIKLRCTSKRRNAIFWIEMLLRQPLTDHRKYCIWRILAPYLINVRKQSEKESYSIISNWLEKCNHIEGLSFYPRSRIQYNIQSAKKMGYYPISLRDLKIENKNLYAILLLKGREECKPMCNINEHDTNISCHRYSYSNSE